jgi:hypothetical protein
MEPIVGTEGTVTLNSLLTAFIKGWEISLDITEQTAGPYIGDGGKLYPYQVSNNLKGKIDADIPKSKDSGQTAMINAGINGTKVPIELVTTDGYTITIPSGIVSGFQMNQDASNTVKISFDFKSFGGYTVA